MLSSSTPPPAACRLAGYLAAGRPREVVACPGAAGSVLVIDRDARTLKDRLLVAHLAADEPPGNAAVVCRCYLADAGRGRPRPVRVEDLLRAPLALDAGERAPRADPVDALGRRYRLGLVSGGPGAIPALRWLRYPAPGSGGRPAVASVRQVVGALQDYEPVRALTARAVAAHRGDARVSVTALRAELERVARSRIVLNRGLREAVLRTVQVEGVSMSRIATRCGRVKRDRRGNLSGETSWLARRLGLAPEGGEQRPTPWIHSDVLALIARAGLGIAPREVELA